MKKIPLLLLFSTKVLLSHNGASQAVTEIITDYGGYWQSSSDSPNPIKPDNSHNLLAFTFNGTRYATGVNNYALTTQGLSFIATSFRSLGVSAINGTINSNTKVGLGAMYDGVFNGASSPPPNGSLPQYLTDGPQGLDIGTGIANLPSGQMVFSVSNLQAGAIGDGVPDILVTQIADPSGSTDSYQFTTSVDAVVGSSVNISFGSINTIGTWTADFYEASQNPMTLGVGFTQTDRPIRLWAADFSAFGITTSNYQDIAKFKMNMAGNSDVAFVAYNNTVVSILPASLTYFKANVLGKDVQLSWQIMSEKEMAYYEIENGDGNSFYSIGKMPATNMQGLQHYSFTHLQATSKPSFYRLRQVDRNGSYTYSHAVRISKGKDLSAIIAYPNPAFNDVIISHSIYDEGIIELWNSAGRKVIAKNIQKGSVSTTISLHTIPAGIYQVLLTIGWSKETICFIKQ